MIPPGGNHEEESVQEMKEGEKGKPKTKDPITFFSLSGEIYKEIKKQLQ